MATKHQSPPVLGVKNVLQALSLPEFIYMHEYNKFTITMISMNGNPQF